MKSLLSRLSYNGNDDDEMHDTNNSEGKKELIKELNMLLHSRVRTSCYESMEEVNATIINYGVNEDELTLTEKLSREKQGEKVIIKLLKRFEPRLIKVDMKVIKNTSDETVYLIEGSHLGKEISLQCQWKRQQGEISINE